MAVLVLLAAAAAAVAGRPAGRHARKGNHAAVQPFLGESETEQLALPGSGQATAPCSVGSASASANCQSAK